jgi:hypothetical protein
VDRALDYLEKVQSTRHQYSKAVAQVCLSIHFTEHGILVYLLSLPAWDQGIHYWQVSTNGLEWKVIFVLT